jgi:hypothetical protein
MALRASNRLADWRGGFITAKVLFVGVLCTNLVYTHQAYPKYRWLTGRGAQVYCVVVALIVASNLWVIARVVA